MLACADSEQLTNGRSKAKASEAGDPVQHAAAYPAPSVHATESAEKKSDGWGKIGAEDFGLWAVVGSIAFIGLVLFAVREYAIPEFLYLLKWGISRHDADQLIFVLGAIAGILLFIPSSLLALLAGTSYGWLLGAALSYVATCIGCLLAFIAARYWFRDWVQNYIASAWSGFSRVDSAIQRDGWRLVLVLRFSPCMPYSVLNYALGVTSVSFAQYASATVVSVLPYSVLFSYLGSLSTDAIQVLHGHWPDANRQQLIAVVVVLLTATVACTAWFLMVGLRPVEDEAGEVEKPGKAGKDFRRGVAATPDSRAGDALLAAVEEGRGV